MNRTLCPLPGTRALMLIPSFLLLACGGDGGAAQFDASGSGPDALPDAPGCTGATLHDVGAGRTAVIGEPGALYGYGDPSILYPRDAAAGFMSYSAVVPGLGVETRVATSIDHGATWSYLGAVNSVTPLTITTTDNSVCSAASCDGSWIHEVSSIVDDPTDPDPARRYKIFGHSYFIIAGGSRRVEIGSIDLWTAPVPAADTKWTETRLLGWSSNSPRSSTDVQTVVTTDPKLSPLLSRCIALTEPGALVRGNSIDLALGCARYESPTSIPIEVFLIRSTDHGASWSPVGTLLDVTDATALGATSTFGPQINAADLFEIAGTTYLFATPTGPVTTTGPTDLYGYRGCLLFRFDDIETGRLARCDGALAVVDAFQGPPGLFNGACSYAQGASATGVAGIVADTGQNPVFQMFQTGVAVP